MKLLVVHKVLKFKQATSLKPYIEFNTEQRNLIDKEDKAKRDIPKLKNNAVFGKCIENVRKRRNLKFETTEKRCQKMVNKPHYRTHKEYLAFDDSLGLVVFQMDKSIEVLDKPNSRCVNIRFIKMHNVR